MSLDTKYRPPTLDDIKGNGDTVAVLKKMLQAPKTAPHAFLFHGPTGCGKTTLGRIVGKGLGAVGRDFKELDSADMRGIDVVRDVIIHQSQFAPFESKCIVWLLDEVHKMTNDAQNALLKRLENPPEHVYFILCTTEPQKLLSTIRGRCSEFKVDLLEDAILYGLLKSIVKKEGTKIKKKIYEQIIRDSLGHPRNAIKILEQTLCVPEKKQLQVAAKAAEMESQSIELCRALIRGDKWNEVALILKGLKGQDAEGIRRSVIHYAQAVLLNTDKSQAGLILECFVEPFFNSGFPGLVYACYTVIKN